jgi:hypothetical protein
VGHKEDKRSVFLFVVPVKLVGNFEGCLSNPYAVLSRSGDFLSSICSGVVPDFVEI